MIRMMANDLSSDYDDVGRYRLFKNTREQWSSGSVDFSKAAQEAPVSTKNLTYSFFILTPVLILCDVVQ